MVINTYNVILKREHNESLIFKSKLLQYRAARQGKAKKKMMNTALVSWFFTQSLNVLFVGVVLFYIWRFTGYCWRRMDMLSGKKFVYWWSWLFTQSLKVFCFLFFFFILRFTGYCWRRMDMLSGKEFVYWWSNTFFREQAFPFFKESQKMCLPRKNLLPFNCNYFRTNQNIPNKLTPLGAIILSQKHLSPVS